LEDNLLNEMYIKVKVQAGAKKEKIEKKKENSFIISVKEPAERNLANTRIKEIIASIYAINVKSVRIISGHQAPSKILSINIPENLL
jgi:uncharacterized protein YggU (UPF0235/DUF167 family)